MSKTSEAYDVIIVGSGPAGIFAALTLTSESARPIRVLMLEKGKGLDKRRCPMQEFHSTCTSCPECSILCGWGGAGAYSDGKLTLSPEIGGFLDRYLENEALRTLINEVDETYIRFGAPRKVFGDSREAIEEIHRVASMHDLLFVPSLVRHIGTGRCAEVLGKMYDHLAERVDINFDSEVERVLEGDSGVEGVRLGDGKEIRAGSVILAPGREGATWLEGETRRLGLSVLSNPVDIGVRVEVPAAVMEHLTQVTYEPKFFFYSRKFDDRVRTFCVNPGGEVVKEHMRGMWSANGHSHAEKKTHNTNFALLVSTTFTEPFDEPIAYGTHIARLANFLGKGVIIQRLGDLQMGRRSTEARLARGIVRPTLRDATPGDLSFVIPYRYLSDILEMLEALDRVAPGVNSRHTLLYGVEVKFYSMQLKLSQVLETRIGGLYAVGDGAGVTRGLIQASASGVMAAREILRKKEAPE